MADNNNRSAMTLSMRRAASSAAAKAQGQGTMPAPSIPSAQSDNQKNNLMAPPQPDTNKMTKTQTMAPKSSDTLAPAASFLLNAGSKVSADPEISDRVNNKKLEPAHNMANMPMRPAQAQPQVLPLTNQIQAKQQNFNSNGTKQRNDDTDSIDWEANQGNPLLAKIPKKPKFFSQEELQQIIRKKYGYDHMNLFQDKEVNERGMASLLGLNGQMQINEVLDKRRDEVEFTKNVVSRAKQEEMEFYQAFKKDHPSLFKKPVVDNKRKKTATNQQAEKRQKVQRQYDNDDFESSSQIPESEQNSESGESDYGRNNKGRSGNRNNLAKTGKRLVKNSAKRDRDSNPKESDYMGSDSEDDRGPRNQKPSDKYARDNGYEKEQRGRADSSQYYVNEQTVQDEKLKKFQELMRSKRNVALNHDDMRKLIIKRSQIEKWVNEPFLRQTLLPPSLKSEHGGQFVKVHVGSKVYKIAEVKQIRENWDQKYTLSNGKTYGLQLLLKVFENNIVKQKWFNISAISDSDVQFQEYDAIKNDRYKQHLTPLNQEMSYYREKAIEEAKNYIYKEGEADFIVRKSFDRALKEGTLGQFPNLLYFQQKKVSEVDTMKEELDRMIQIDEKDEQRQRKIDKDISIARKIITKLEADLKQIDAHLACDLRVVKQVNSAGQKMDTTIRVDSIQKKEDQKLYHEWIERQQKMKDNGEQTTVVDNIIEKSKLDADIKQIYKSQRVIDGTFFEQVQHHKRVIGSSHSHITTKLDLQKFQPSLLKDKFNQDLLNNKKTQQKYISKANPELLKFINAQKQQSQVKSITLEDYLKK